MPAMRSFVRLFLLLAIWCADARALTVSENALRLEDSREGNVLLGAERAVLEKGEIYKTIVLLWGRLEIHGEVEEVVVLSGHVVFHEGARLSKSLVVMGGTFESQPGAKVAAENVIAQVPGPAWRILQSLANLWRENVGWVSKLLAGLVTSVLGWLLAWAIFAGFPGLQNQLEGQMFRDWGKNAVVAFLGSISAPMLFALLLISIVGILAIPFYVLVLMLAAALSYSGAALWAGHRILPPRVGERIRPAGLLLGFIAFQFLWVVPVWWASLPVLILWGLAWGALLRGLRLLWK
jgi:hypothetical protein